MALPLEARRERMKAMAEAIAPYYEQIEKENMKNQETLPVVDRVPEKSQRENSIVATKQFRVDLDGVLQRLKCSESSRERALAITKVQEAIMWLGMDLKAQGTDNPYPNSYNPSNTIVEPTADGLKL